MKRLSLWWRALRPFSLTVSFLPPLLGGALALLLGRPVSPLTLSLTLIGCMAAHGASNLISDYYDFVKRVDRPGTYGSSGLLVAGLVKPKVFLAGGGFLGTLAGAIGLFFLFTRPGTWPMAGVILLGGLLGLLYTAPPLELKYHAWGDVAVFLAFGPLMMLGTLWVHTGTLEPLAFWVSLPPAFLVDAILHSNNLRDRESDRVAGIETFAIKLGLRGSKLFYLLLLASAYLSLLLLVSTGILPGPTLLPLLSLPLAVKCARKVWHKELYPPEAFALIDGETAGLHLCFGLFYLLGLLLSLLTGGAR